MKRLMLIIILVLVVFFAVGENEELLLNGGRKTVSENLGRGTKKLFLTAKDYINRKKEAYLIKIGVGPDGPGSGTDGMNTLAEKAGLYRRVESLLKKEKAIRAGVENVKRSGDKSIGILKYELERADGFLRKAYKSVFHEFSNKHDVAVISSH